MGMVTNQLKVPSIHCVPIDTFSTEPKPKNCPLNSNTQFFNVRVAVEQISFHIVNYLSLASLVAWQQHIVPITEDKVYGNSTKWLPAI